MSSLPARRRCPPSTSSASTTWSSSRPAAAQFPLDRAKHALRAYVLQPGVDHVSIAHDDFARAWVETIFRLRVGNDSSAAQSGKATLKDIDEASGWLGDNKTHEVAPFADYKGNKAEASWLPDEACARAWVRVVTPPATKRR